MGVGEQGWNSGDSTHLPPLWPGFNSRTRRHMWVELAVGSRPRSEGFSDFLSPTKINNSKFQFDREYTAPQASSFKFYRV